MYILPPIRTYPLSKDGVAAIKIIGEGPKGAKSFNLIRKAEILETLGFLFPRRNLVIKQSILLEGLRHAGLKHEWDNEPLPWDRRAREKFTLWAMDTFWPVVEKIFEGRAFFVRSNAPGDSLGRGVYSSVPFANLCRTYADDRLRKLGFANLLMHVVESYFSETAEKFRERAGFENSGINVMLCQFIGRVGAISEDERLLVPFMSAVVKSTLLHENPGDGLIRFEYGMGKGAISGRTLLYRERTDLPVDYPGSDTLEFETISGRGRVKRIDSSARNMNAITVDVGSETERIFGPEHEAIFGLVLRSAYPFIERQFIVEGYELLKWLANKIPVLEHANDGPIYLECVVSSFRDRLRWFVVQVSDFDPVHQLPNPPEKDVFISSDFYGHGMLENGRRNVFILGKEFVKNPDWKARLSEINKANKGFIVLIPQKALTGLDLTELSGGHFSNAGAVIEYRTLGSYKFERNLHLEGPSSEHFEQVMQDFDVLFIAAQNVLSNEEAATVNPAGITEGTALVSAACDRERGFAWWRIRELNLSQTN
ncbi:hypothetical protein HY991_00415 [Candidatus Micrarchaeota archaeon]|nr:hypothetical protein [Candidatus Micrarchaeota archaeon]